MHKRGGFERLAGWLTRHLARGESAQLIINEREQFLGGFGIALLDAVDRSTSLGSPVGICELERAGQIGHGGHGRPLLLVSGRLGLEGHPLPGLDAKRTGPQDLDVEGTRSRPLKPSRLRDCQELLGCQALQLLREARRSRDNAALSGNRIGMA